MLAWMTYVELGEPSDPKVIERALGKWEVSTEQLYHFLRLVDKVALVRRLGGESPLPPGRGSHILETMLQPLETVGDSDKSLNLDRLVPKAVPVDLAKASIPRISEHVDGGVSDALSSFRSFLHSSLSMPLIHGVAGAWPEEKLPCGAGCATPCPLLASGCKGCGCTGTSAGAWPGAGVV